MRHAYYLDFAVFDAKLRHIGIVGENSRQVLDNHNARRRGVLAHLQGTLSVRKRPWYAMARRAARGTKDGNSMRERVLLGGKAHSKER